MTVHNFSTQHNTEQSVAVKYNSYPVSNITECNHNVSGLDESTEYLLKKVICEK